MLFVRCVSVLFLGKEKKAVITKNQIMFRKYRILSLLGSGSSAQVYLAEHMKLKTHRAIKCVPKALSQPTSILQEASLLKNLSHPGIPVIYDVEEDETSYYLIEEYIQGESFHAYMQNHNTISQETILSFGLQLCDIFEYLHGQALPLLYLDLKPEHIILCGNQLKLIDFGNSEGFGSRGFAAPEQYKSGACSKQADIYAIAALLYYMLTGELLQPVPNGKLKFPKECSGKFRQIIQKAAAIDPKDRYSNVSELKVQLQKIYIHRNNILTKEKSKKILVVGSSEGIGSTHIAIALTCWLNESGHSALFLEKNDKGVLGALVRYKAGIREKNGVCYYRDFQGMGSLSQGEREEAWEFRVEDFGKDLEAVAREEEMSMVLLVIGGKPWEIEEAVAAYELLSGEENLTLLCNFGGRRMGGEYEKNLRRKVYSFPFDEDPFAITKEKNKLFETLFKIGLPLGRPAAQ